MNMCKGIKQLPLLGEVKNQKGLRSESGEGQGAEMARVKSETVVRAQVIERCSIKNEDFVLENINKVRRLCDNVVAGSAP